ncbi:MAG: alpha-L-fucosidase [Verrucomicrobia bacterium]|nr:alpha-L-fucosidase [Verrucomicrobiota bacterium]
MRVFFALTGVLVLLPSLSGWAQTNTNTPSILVPSAQDPNKDTRLAWWREAKFGMFIHWGVYSAFGGEWNGQKVEGYAEHLQRIMKIKREEYLEKVVKPFNPTEFNADEWVKTVKDTGMQYIVITSMHHDGVAMFDSKTDDYNVVKTSKFGRDPLKELKEACDKYGVKLGFYYSHAQDWSISGDPRYPEPNGPERRKAVVEKKVLPQIKELIEKYHPALFWGDTAHLNPKELNEQILAYLRKEDPNLIINGRVAGAIYGDYLTTPDRPLEFGPMTKPEEQDWEAIPTTNESYGYHSLDKSHKPPAHFIRLLVKAAAKGGNLLMNIGPMGNGKMAPEDLAILHAIGKWWSVNGESIRGTARTPLMRQSWGDSTLKGKSLYLHVFDWPNDRKLVVGGLKGEIESAVLLADREKALKVKRRGLDVEIELPEKVPDDADSVILVQCREVPQGDPIFLLQNNLTNRLSVFFADLLGTQKKDGWRLGRGTANSANVTGWNQKECGVKWSTRVNQKTDFDVIVRYDAPGADGKAKVETMGGTVTAKSEDTFGGTFTVQIGSQKLKGEVVQQGDGVELNLGKVTLEPGPVEILVTTDTITGKELMRLQSVTLTPR